MTFRGLLIAGAALSITACATQPEPTQIVDRGPVQAPAPVEQPRSVTPPPVTDNSVITEDYAAYVPVPGSAEEFATVAGERVYFEYDQYTLSEASRATLRSQAQWLNTYNQVNVVIEGHCDERGTRDYNLALGARRANSVKDYLVTLGVDPRRLTTISYGKERPVDPGSNAQAWALNRNGYSRLLIGASS